MAGIPKLVDLCIDTIAVELLQEDNNDDILSVVYELPSELFDGLVPRLPPLALQKLQENLPINFRESREQTYNSARHCLKRRRYDILDATWSALYRNRWRSHCQPKEGATWFDRNEEKDYQIDDWRQKYWETHLQEYAQPPNQFYHTILLSCNPLLFCGRADCAFSSSCVDAIAETALLPSYDGFVGEIQIPDGILEHIGCKDHSNKLTQNYLKFYYHCQRFAVYARRLRLPNALCTAETCELFQNSKLGNLELQWIKSNDHVEGLCKLLNQSSGTLKSIEFIHCKLSPDFVNAICGCLQSHGVEHFSIKRSSFLRADSAPIPVGLTRFLTWGRSLHSVTLCDDRLGRSFARRILNTLLDASSSLSMLDLSENNISGFLSQFRWGLHGKGNDKSLQSIRVLNLRSCNLEQDDARSLKYALNHMPNLENLDLSDNPIEDGIGSLITYFTEISGRDLPFVDLKLENCEVSCNHATELLRVLSTMSNPPRVLSLKGNWLGSKIGAPLGRFMGTGVLSLDVEDIGLGSSGFQLAVEKMPEELKIAYINISNNLGGNGAAEFISNIIKRADKIVAVDARYNSMSVESLSVISSGLKASKGRLEHLDLTGNSFCHQPTEAESVLAELRTRGKLPRNILFSAAPNAPYDDDP